LGEAAFYVRRKTAKLKRIRRFYGSPKSRQLPPCRHRRGVAGGKNRKKAVFFYVFRKKIEKK